MTLLIDAAGVSQATGKRRAAASSYPRYQAETLRGAVVDFTADGGYLDFVFTAG